MHTVRGCERIICVLEPDIDETIECLPGDRTRRTQCPCCCTCGCNGSGSSRGILGLRVAGASEDSSNSEKRQEMHFKALQRTKTADQCCCDDQEVRGQEWLVIMMKSSTSMAIHISKQLIDLQRSLLPGEGDWENIVAASSSHVCGFESCSRNRDVFDGGGCQLVTADV